MSITKQLYIIVNTNQSIQKQNIRYQIPFCKRTDKRKQN